MFLAGSLRPSMWLCILSGKPPSNGLGVSRPGLRFASCGSRLRRPSMDLFCFPENL